jgi:hypothetical protein
MLGPKIIADEPIHPREDGGCHSVERITTGVRRANSGGWAAIRNGKLIDSFTGPGSRAAAIRAAGTNARVS